MTFEQADRPGAYTFHDIPEQECWSLLESRHVGRVAFEGDDGLMVFPVNHAVHESMVYFRTSAYASIVTRLRRDDRASFQIDDLDEYLRAGWCVLVVGTAELLDPGESDALPSFENPEPWASGVRTVMVRIKPRRVTGRRVLAG